MANTPAANTPVSLDKSLNTVMDSGTVTLSWDFVVLESWDKAGRAVIEVPKYYRPDLGEDIRCTLLDATKTVMEYLYCDF